ncbi:transcription factor bHLH113-like isoform X2 [Tripterygium wilfordii]|uniref:transcription factor bHLH113-like isoform X2 n=1 Tax=Tripterygium wilfordii TaxID=458696 RepID=UPI0018F7F97D|nr:transcription factor bHLH113-like isoform X2 [Tripterygium wilfordii]
MADGEGFEGDHEGTSTTATSFSQLLFADDDVVSLDMGQSFYFNTTTSTERPPKMLCFGSYENEDELVIATSFDGASATKKCSTPQKSKATTKSRVTCTATATDSSSASSGNNGSTTVTTLSKSSRKRGSGQEPVQGIAKPAIGLRSSKVETESPPSTGLKKVRREKLGERVATLQHLVSPFGKTDTASVLHEAMGYIKFLQDQVQVLCSPYLQHQSHMGLLNIVPTLTVVKEHYCGQESTVKRVSRN